MTIVWSLNKEIKETLFKAGFFLHYLQYEQISDKLLVFFKDHH